MNQCESECENEEGWCCKFQSQGRRRWKSVRKGANYPFFCVLGLCKPSPD